MTVKRQLKEGSLYMQDSQKGIIGAFIAQSEYGDILEMAGGTGPEAVNLYGYPEYFPDWNVGIVKNIADEHRKIKGLLPQVLLFFFALVACPAEVFLLVLLPICM